MGRVRFNTTNVVGALWIGIIAFGGGSAFANDAADEAEKLVRHGIELRRHRDDEAAARDFQQAYKLYASPRTAAQLGLAKQALGLWEEAEHYVAEALRTGASDSWVSKHRGVLDEALGTIQKHLGRIEVIGDPEGAEVAMNGRRVGKLPLAEPVRVSEGSVDIDVRAAGYASAQRTITLVGGQYQRVVFHLTKVGTATAEVAKVAPRRTEPTTDSVASDRAVDAPGQPRPAAIAAERAGRGTDGGPSTQRIFLKWTAAGLALGGLVTGVVGTALHSSNVDKFNGRCWNDGGRGVLSDGTPDTECQALLQTFRGDRTVAIVGFAVAGALTGAWLALVLTEPSGSTGTREQAAHRPFCGPNVTGLGLSCAARF